MTLKGIGKTEVIQKDILNSKIIILLFIIFVMALSFGLHFFILTSIFLLASHIIYLKGDKEILTPAQKDKLFGCSIVFLLIIILIIISAIIIIVGMGAYGII